VTSIVLERQEIVGLFWPLLEAAAGTQGQWLGRGPFLTSPLGENFDSQGRSCPPGMNLSPRGEVIPWV
jgi:hypothetical protein